VVEGRGDSRLGIRFAALYQMIALVISHPSPLPLDYVPFLDHAGVASIDISFYSDAYNGVYHSAYDSLYWMEKFGGI